MKDEALCLHPSSFILHLFSYSPVTSSPAPGGQLASMRPNTTPKIAPKTIAGRYCPVVVASRPETMTMKMAMPATVKIFDLGLRAGAAALAAGLGAAAAAGAAAGLGAAAAGAAVAAGATAPPGALAALAARMAA